MIKTDFIKICDMTFYNLIFLLLAIGVASIYITRIYKPLDTNNKKLHTSSILLRIALELSGVILLSYFVGILVKRIPSPFNNIYGYVHNESIISAGPVFTMILLSYFIRFKDDLILFMESITNETINIYPVINDKSNKKNIK
jgi:hypothetical protein